MYKCLVLLWCISVFLLTTKQEPYTEFHNNVFMDYQRAKLQVKVLFG